MATKKLYSNFVKKAKKKGDFTGKIVKPIQRAKRNTV